MSRLPPRVLGPEAVARQVDSHVASDCPGPLATTVGGWLIQAVTRRGRVRRSRFSEHPSQRSNGDDDPSADPQCRDVAVSRRLVSGPA